MAGLILPNGPVVAGDVASTARRSRGVNWTEEETELLLEVWADREVQVLLETGPHNRQAFEKVSYMMTQRGMEKTPAQCREKIKKLKTIYRNLNNGQGKVSRKIRGRLVQKLHQVMGSISVNMSSLSTQKELETEPNMVGNNVMTHNQDPSAGTVDGRARLSDEFGGNGNSIYFSAISAALGPNTDFLASASSSSDSSSTEEDMEPAEVAQHQQPQPQHQQHQTTMAPSDNMSSPRKRSRKSRKKKSRQSALYLLIEKIVASQAAAQERFISLEEKRIQNEKELEEKRLQAEARRQEAQRQHELKLLSTMAQQMANVLRSLNPMTFTTTRGETVATPLTVAVTSAEHVKSHEEVVIGVANGCADYGHPDGTVYSTI